MYEVEIKSLLGSEENANRLVEKLFEHDAHARIVGESDQKNHYFLGSDRERLFENVGKLFSKNDAKRLESTLKIAKEISVRTRESDGSVLLVVKASVDDTTSENGTARLEFEATTSETLDVLDGAIIAGGFEVQAKWSRKRKEYELSDSTRVCIDRNAGYGYLAEFERIVSDPTQIELTKIALRELMKKFNIEELSQSRLERMFEYYNAHWRDYYGTNRIFTIE